MIRNAREEHHKTCTKNVFAVLNHRHIVDAEIVVVVNRHTQFYDCIVQDLEH